MRSALFVGAALALVSMASASNATVNLTLGSGWQSGQVNARNTNQVGAPIVFTVATGTGVFSLTDGFLTGDIYKVKICIFSTTFCVSGDSTFTTAPDPINNNLGPAAAFYAPAWISNAWSHYQIELSPGTYSVTVQDRCPQAGLCTINTYPAGFGFRLDAVPEPASWALMVAGLGMTGSLLRRRRPTVVAA
jgi:hypothetical protein